MKKTIPLIIVIVGGIIFVLYALSPHKLIQDDFYNKFYIPWLMHLHLGLLFWEFISLCMMHSSKIKRKAPKWQYSYFFLPVLSLHL